MQLLAVAYPDTLTGPVAMEELERFGRDFAIRWDQMAVNVRDDDGVFRTYTHAVITSGQPAWAMLWGQLFATLFFIPILGMGIGSQLAPLIERIRTAGLDPLFVERIRKQVDPGTSVLFVLVDRVSSDVVVSALDALGGTVLQSDLRENAGKMLQKALHDGTRVA
jgi:uncharacterized membrane protein